MGSTRSPNTTPSSTADIGDGNTAIYAINCLLLKLQHGLRREWIVTELGGGRKLSFDNQIRSELLHLSI